MTNYFSSYSHLWINTDILNKHSFDLELYAHSDLEPLFPM